MDKAPVKSTFFSHSFLIFITRFFPSLANLVVVIWYSRRLPPGLYGDYQSFWIELNLLYPIACFGIHVFAVTYSAEALKTLARGIKKSAYGLYVLWVLLLGCIFAWLQSRAGLVAAPVSLVFFVLFSASMLLESFLIVFRKFTSLVTVNVIYSVAFMAAHGYMLQNSFSVQGVFSLLLALIAFKVIVCAAIVFGAARKAQEPVGSWSFVPGDVKSLWLHLGFYDVLQVLFSWIDKFLISLLFSAQVSAIYFNGSLNIPFLPLLTGAAGSAVLIQLASGKGNDKAAAVFLMNQTGRVLSCIIFPVFLFLLLFSSELVPAILSGKYTAAIPVFVVSILVLPVRAYSFTTLLQRMHKGSVINAGAIADLVIACALMYPLYKLMGLPGIALSFVVSTWMQATFYLLYTARMLQVSPLRLLPAGNWAVKLILFSSILLCVRQIGRHWSANNIPLILAGVVTFFLVVGSLALEFKRQKRYGSNEQA